MIYVYDDLISKALKQIDSVLFCNRSIIFLSQADIEKIVISLKKDYYHNEQVFNQTESEANESLNYILKTMDFRSFGILVITQNECFLHKKLDFQK